jgi:ketosteroid isomerase-like protein
MSRTQDTPEVELLHRCFAAMSGGDLSVLEDSLAEDAKWRTVVEGATNCQGRSTIVAIIKDNLGGTWRGQIEETVQAGPRVLVAFRPERSADAANRPLDGGTVYMVVTINDARVTELKGCADRSAAEEYLATGGTPARRAPVLEGPGRPPVVEPPPEQRVSGLIPFVHVEDVQRAIDFYHHLGFTLASVYKYDGTPVWAELESERAQLMVSTDGDPIDPAGQGVLFYLYSTDLAALREQLLTAGVDAGEIEDGRPGPSEQMCVIDPDGYELMIAQIET